MDTIVGLSQASPSGDAGTVWPPPPSDEARPFLVVPFKTLFQRMEGSVPDFRTGTIQLNDAGIVIHGKVIVPYERQIPILIASMLFGLLFIIGYFYYEYAYRQNAMLTLNWQQVRHLVVEPKKRQVCLVYLALNHKGVVKPYSLTFQLEPELYNAFTLIAHQRMGDRILVARLRSWISPPVWIFLGGFVVSCIILGISIAIDSMEMLH